jgi:beta-glucosidase-like glycosyl hydrolase/CubicO group peptidase (beta-lactamase class C family)
MNIKQLLSVAVLSVASLVLVSAKEPVEPVLLRNANKQKMKQWVDSVYNRMTPDERIGQLIIIHVAGDNTPNNRQRITNLVKNKHAGGILFLKGTPQNQAMLTNLAQENAKIPLMVTADAEWGLSMRLSNTTKFPRNMMLGAIQNDSLLYKYGQEMARQCKLMGIHVNFAPDMDVNSNPDNPVIGTRSFGENINRVSQAGIAFSKGSENNGVLSTTKHFPGHGDTSTDSHETLPLIRHNRSRLNSVELVPFQRYIDAGLGSVMVGHLNIPSLDNSGSPSSLSKKVVTDLLQTEMGFSGLVFSDGLAMKGVSTEKDMASRILLAGNDMLVGPISPEKEFDALKAAVKNGTISESLIEQKCKKILQYKYLLGATKYQAINTSNLVEQLNSPQAEWLCRKLNAEAMTLLQNNGDILPLKDLNKQSIAVVSLGATARSPFHKTLTMYANVATFNVANAAGISAIKAQLAKYNTMIVSVHSANGYSNADIQNLIADKKSIVAFFVSPYNTSKFAPSLKKADVIVMAYENSDYAQEYAAQAIFGGYGMSGKLPVSINNSYKEGTGLRTDKTRLAYNLPEDIGLRSADFDHIANIVEEGISSQAFPGCQVLVAKDGVVIYNRAFGTFEYNKKRDVTDEDLYDLASMTKASATIPALMKLYDNKSITLQGSLGKHIPLLRNTDKESLTIRQALFHETGLPSFLQYYMPAIDESSYAGNLFSYKQADGYPALIDNGAWARTDFRYNPSLISSVPKAGFEKQIADGLYVSNLYNDVVIGMIANSKQRAKKSYLYSCLNFMLLKEVVEDVSKTDLNTFLQENFYERLGAYTTTYNPLKKINKSNIAPTERDNFLRKQLLQGYVDDEGAAFLGGVSGNAGLFSNANDLAKLYQMWLNGGVYGNEKYLNKATVDLFTLTKSPNSRRGLGFDKPDMFSSKSSPTSPNTPASVYGHTGFTGTCFWVDPDNKLIYIFLSNRVNELRTHKKLMSLNIRPRIQEVIYNAIY